ncbi:hypothetical protein KCU87_g3085, partial [Aureobasidium melanogenum]
MAAERDPKQNTASAVVDDDEPDDWDKRIFSTGCSVENTRLNDCFFEKKDWRQCKTEVSWSEQPASGLRSLGLWASVLGSLVSQAYTDHSQQMEEFKQCWKKQGNDRRTDQKNV